MNQQMSANSYSFSLSLPLFLPSHLPLYLCFSNLKTEIDFYSFIFIYNLVICTLITKYVFCVFLSLLYSLFPIMCEYRYNLNLLKVVKMYVPECDLCWILCALQKYVHSPIVGWSIHYMPTFDDGIIQISSILTDFLKMLL